MTGMSMFSQKTGQAEKLAIEGIRRWMAGYATGDIGCWEMAWTLYAKALGKEKAPGPVSGLSCYARSLNAYGARQLCLFPYDCPKLCQDECLVMSLVAASQHNQKKAIEMISDVLIREDGRADAIHAAREFATALQKCDLEFTEVDVESLYLDECPLKRFHGSSSSSH